MCIIWSVKCGEWQEEKQGKLVHFVAFDRVYGLNGVDINVAAISIRVIVTRLVSAAGTGYFYTIKKPRIRERMTLRKYDPVGMSSSNSQYYYLYSPPPHK